MTREPTPSQKRLRTVIGNAARLRWAQRAAGKPGKYAVSGDGKTYSNSQRTAERVIYCATCKAPVVDTDAARRGHAARVGCERI